MSEQNGLRWTPGAEAMLDRAEEMEAWQPHELPVVQAFIEGRVLERDGEWVEEEDVAAGLRWYRKGRQRA